MDYTTNDDETTHDFAFAPEHGGGRVVRTPSWFLRDGNIPAGVKVLYQVLCSYAGEDAPKFPAMASLRGHLGVSQPTLSKYLFALECVGLLEIVRSPLGAVKSYHLCTVKEN